MFSIEYTHNDGERYVTELVDTGKQVAEIAGHIPYHKLRVETEDGEIIGDGEDTETVTISVISGLDFVSNNRETIIEYDGNVTLSVDRQQTIKTLANGSVSFELSTTKSAGSEIELVAGSLADHPAESDRATIEVVS